MAKKSAMKQLWDGNKLVGLIIHCPTAANVAPTRFEEEIVRIFNEHQELRTANAKLRALLINAEPKWAIQNWLERELEKSQEDFDKTWNKPSRKQRSCEMAKHINQRRTMNKIMSLNQQIQQLRAENAKLREQIERERIAAQQLCQIYFEIAEEVYSEDVVRQKREAKLKQALAKKGE